MIIMLGQNVDVMIPRNGICQGYTIIILRLSVPVINRLHSLPFYKRPHELFTDVSISIFRFGLEDE